jgi:predicted DNA-binding antitoxin AbrB/MazE fold protein
MSERIDAIFENGVFRPEVPVSIANGQRVSLDVATKSAPSDDLADVADLLDLEFFEACRKSAQAAPSLDEVHAILAAFPDSLSDRISAERDER